MLCRSRIVSFTEKNINGKKDRDNLPEDLTPLNKEKYSMQYTMKTQTVSFKVGAPISFIPLLS